MASILASLGRPQCMNCMRRAVGSFSDAFLQSTRQPARGKKKMAKVSTVKVRLLADIPRYGRQGTIIPIAAGRMRNEFYPKKMAEYMTTAQLREIGMLDAVLERDSTFGIIQPQTAQPEVKEEAPLNVQVDLLKPERATEVLSTLLPPSIVFHRTAILSTPAPSTRHSPSIPATSTISAAAQQAVPPEPPLKTSIYGSVTTTDIADNLKAVLAENKEGVRVVLTPEDITFVSKGEESDRVKHLGVFEIEIRIKGALGSVRRLVQVKAQE